MGKGAGGRNWNAMLDWKPFLKPVLADLVSAIPKHGAADGFYGDTMTKCLQSQNHTEHGR